MGLQPKSPAWRATYRLQLRKTFPLDQAARITGYLDELGVSHLYLSPILEARPDSNHGYDAIDPLVVSRERGGEEGFQKVINQVEKSRSISGVILDIVPNHVAATWRNPYWWNILKEGPGSEYWEYFDIRPTRDGRYGVVLPVLGRSRQAVLAARELQLGIRNQEIVFHYYDNHFPVAPHSYPQVLQLIANEFNEKSSKAQKWFAQIEKIYQKAHAKDPDHREKIWAEAFSEWRKTDPVAERAFDLNLKSLPIKAVEDILEDQSYYLEEWRSGSREINYRRFFDINDLAAIRVEDEEVFKWDHQKIRELIRSYPQIHGLRVDHVDGLTDPEGYLKRLTSISKNIWVEKILGEGETLPTAWPVQGTTGYEFSGLSARLFVDLPGLLHLHSHYTRHVDRRWERFHDCVYDSKREMLESHFVSEVDYLTDQFFLLAGGSLPVDESSSLSMTSRRKTERAKQIRFTRKDMREALRELTSSLRVYRTYFASGDSSKNRWLLSAFAEVEGRGRLFSKEALAWLRHLLIEGGLESTDDAEDASALIKRWEQLTGPVMAKGLEDTALYRYFPLLSLNVVGGEPDWTGDGAIEFHAFNQERLRSQPHSMSATSTHDTKRSEDVRSRIHVLSELAEDWSENFETWHRMNEGARTDVGGRTVPGRSTEYMIYETLAGTWPFDGKIDDSYIERIKQYLLKAAREGKSETSWTEPDQAYENALMGFIEAILKPTERSGTAKKTSGFLASFAEFAETCAYFGAFNALTLLVLKVSCPGLPDFYQGTELWDLSLVDPDNRRPVDYDLRKKLLDGITERFGSEPLTALLPSAGRRGQEVVSSKAAATALRALCANWKTGEIKLYLTWRLLALRRLLPELFINGDYYAIEPKGAGRRHFVCYLRRTQDESGATLWALIAVPRFLASRMEVGAKLEIEDELILSTEFPLPPGAPSEWTNAFTGKQIQSSLPVARDLLDGLPLAIYVSRVQA